MGFSEITVTTKRPEIPSADFSFCVDFKKGEGSASRVFSATHAFIRACETIDLELVTSVDANIQPVMVLEDIEVSSLKTYFKTILEAIDDQSIKTLNWKPAVGAYLVKAKYYIIRWCESNENPKELLSLQRSIQELAEETDVRHIPAYSPISSGSLVKAIKDFQEVKGHLAAGDKASMVVSENEIAHFNLSSRIDIENIQFLATRETQIHSIPSMVLVVKKPDYLGNSMWDFRYGKKSISARMEHSEWLDQFQQRRVDVRPGDALKCQVRMEVLYGYDNELMAEKYYIELVHEVLEDRDKQTTIGFQDQANDKH